MYGMGYGMGNQYGYPYGMVVSNPYMYSSHVSSSLKSVILIAFQAKSRIEADTYSTDCPCEHRQAELICSLYWRGSLATRAPQIMSRPPHHHTCTHSARLSR